MSWKRISSGLVNHFKHSSITVCASSSEDTSSSNNTVTSSIINKSITDESIASSTSIHQRPIDNIRVVPSQRQRQRSNLESTATNTTTATTANNVRESCNVISSNLTSRSSNNKNLELPVLQAEDPPSSDQAYNEVPTGEDLNSITQSSLSSASSAQHMYQAQHKEEEVEETEIPATTSAQAANVGDLNRRNNYSIMDQVFLEEQPEFQQNSKMKDFFSSVMNSTRRISTTTTTTTTYNNHHSNNILAIPPANTNTAPTEDTISSKMIHQKYDMQRCCRPFARRPSSSSSSSTSHSQSQSQRRVIFPTLYSNPTTSSNSNVKTKAPAPVTATSQPENHIDAYALKGDDGKILGPTRLKDTETNFSMTETDTPIPSFISLQSNTLNTLPQAVATTRTTASATHFGHPSEVKHSVSNDDSLITLSTSSISYVKRNQSYDDACHDPLHSDHSIQDEVDVPSSSPASSPRGDNAKNVPILPVPPPLSPLSQTSEKNRSNSIDSYNGKMPRRPSILRNSSKKSTTTNTTSPCPPTPSPPLSSLSFPTRNDKLNATFHGFTVELNEAESLNYQQDLHVAKNTRKLRKSLSDSCLHGFKMKKVFAETTAVSTSIPNNNNLLLESKDSMSSSCTSSLHTSRIKNRSSPQHTNENRRQVLYHATGQMTRHISYEEMGRNKIIRFDPRIWVHEIQCPPVEKIWYSESDLNRFKCEALLRIRKWSKRARQSRRPSNNTMMIPTGTGRILSHGDANGQDYNNRSNQRITYTNPALSCEAEEDDDEVHAMAKMITLRRTAMMHEFKSVLIVDNHDIFLNLLSKGVKMMLPQVQITTATSVDQALKIIEGTNSSLRRNSRIESCSHGFDLIIVEERLVPHNHQSLQKGWDRRRYQNGSKLIEKIKKDIDNTPAHKKVNRRHPLIVGVSAYLNHDEQRLIASGADTVWGKPPPRMDDQLRLKLLQKIMEKRNRPNGNELFQ